ncbi:arrestin domain-containing protein [Colletotrichum musicola]|uniref:Arrestin domain-containing protein n=1 Tax=Colletotrichum musicola TaxID=2175873 RepID=A0A8H6K5G8_9PEZI|nr:arrestin domain-containing protein [Colletotrichum musicola]
MRSISNHVSRLAGMAPKSKELDVTVDNHYTSKVYTCGSIIAGSVVITPKRDTRFARVQVELVGRASIQLQDAYVSKRTSLLLLKVDMPVPESCYPRPRVFRAGQTYRIPFRFVLPRHLTDGACAHAVESGIVRDAHLRLPSTLSDWDADDMSPNFVSVRYCVRARVMYPCSPEVGGGMIALLSAEHRLNVVAPSPEDPPLSIDTYDKHYTLTQSKQLRKSVFSTPLGRVTATATQPPAVLLSPDGHGAGSSSFHVRLAYELSLPDAAPPDIGLASVKLVARTWYCAQQMRALPNTGASREPFSLSTKVLWKAVEYESWKHSASDSTTGDAYKASLRAEFRLPTSKHVFPPTFHSCLVSRTYALEVNIDAGGSVIRLVLPIQVAMKPVDQPPQPAPVEGELPGWQA